MKKKIIIFIHNYDGFMKIYIDDIIQSLLQKIIKFFYIIKIK